jgi:hypothetical protein
MPRAASCETSSSRRSPEIAENHPRIPPTSPVK